MCRHERFRAALDREVSRIVLRFVGWPYTEIVCLAINQEVAERVDYLFKLLDGTTLDERHSFVTKL